MVNFDKIANEHKRRQNLIFDNDTKLQQEEGEANLLPPCKEILIEIDAIELGGLASDRLKQSIDGEQRQEDANDYEAMANVLNRSDQFNLVHREDRNDVLDVENSSDDEQLDGMIEIMDMMNDIDNVSSHLNELTSDDDGDELDEFARRRRNNSRNEPVSRRRFRIGGTRAQEYDRLMHRLNVN